MEHPNVVMREDPETAAKVLGFVLDGLEERDYKYIDEHINITEVVPSACLRAAFYRRKLGVENFTEDKTRLALWRGSVFDMVMNERVEASGGKSQVHITIPSKSGEFNLSGYADWYFPDEGAVYEFKTIISNYYLKDGAKIDHIAQVLAYAYALSARKAFIVYFDIGDFKVFEVDTSNKREWAEYLLKRAEELYNALKTNTLLEKNEGWRCRSCPYKDICGRDAHE